jgi:hypothetical protein
MIYNLCKYLENELTGETIFRNNKVKIAPANQIPDRYILVIESPSTRTPWFGYIEQSMQVITRDIDAPKARKLAYDIHDLLKTRFGLILPADTIDGITYPAFQIAQISSISEPQSIGADENGRFEFSTNYKVIYRR